MTLNGLQFRALQDALMKAFLTKQELAQMVRVRLDVSLEVIAGSGDYKAVVFKLIEWADSTDKVLELVQGARLENPGNRALAALDMAAPTAGPEGAPPSRRPIDPGWHALRLQLYAEAAQAAARIATATSGQAVVDAEKRFWELYWGPLSMVEDRLVEGAMVAFGDELSAWEDREGPPPDHLRSLCFALAKALRTSFLGEHEDE